LRQQRNAARLSYRRGACLSLRLSVRLSHSAIVSKQCRLDHEKPSPSFVKDSRLGIRKAFLKIRTGSSHPKELNEGSGGKKIAIFNQ